ncbi:hypothetical protein GLOIN_2v1767876 [Rhizophagus irregularis DAOM 181602=DAOM 197198]|uniref:SAM domain-containing protein n=1 Tax=Rhizophagus irregularis (strain DAOM 181602 / DAOM 197198 / MUCL 43194) TaxID=747089 RepID=A0A2P4QI56_RHIID|nr:hypothetical protein GLOIN_2v1767876 [Rhizophagus irregularis DAOM 181602=DAOM 197198]POG77323.1 hypothetical protein GLOIN_2v1767876 [Rhizophagus irregularis DAOM 181602=DAOM 197198]|eukprot:XP_025184189.1 hypothetical protein GLOIN_2v1767876 [Rhizophagus irregularis DAOM 181602=DAOM 197198]
MSKHFFHCFGHIHLENENDAGTFFSKVRDGEFCVEGRPINFLASRQAGSKDPILYKIDETITSTIEPPTILNEPTTSKPSISIENFKEFGTGRLVEFLRNDKNLSELKLDDNFFMKIMEENIPRRTFLKLTKSDLRECGVRLDPSLELEEYIQELGVKKECQKILKQVAEERTNHEAENAELRSRIKELENGRTDTVAECEKADMSGEKSLEDKKTDAFLDEAHNKWEEEEKHAIEISPNNDCPNRDIISLYKDTREAKVDVIKSNREFKSMYKDFMANNNAGKKKAKGQVYDLPNAKRKILCKQTQKALRIGNLFDR